MTTLCQEIYRFHAIPIKLPMSFLAKLGKKILNLYGDTKEQKQYWERKTELEESGSLTSDYTTKLQSSKQHGAGTKPEI